jgi:hypothetical protein
VQRLAAISIGPEFSKSKRKGKKGEEWDKRKKKEKEGNKMKNRRKNERKNKREKKREKKRWEIGRSPTRPSCEGNHPLSELNM